MKYGDDFALQDDEDSSGKKDESSCAAGEACWEE